MSTQEFEYEFDIIWDNIMSNQAPSLDAYEKSVFLTQAQEALVRQAYSSFETNEESRSNLSTLITQAELEEVTSNKHIVPESIMYKTPRDLMFIIQESAMSDSKRCRGGKNILVKPVTHDDFWESYNNPFRGANGNRVLRISVSDSNASYLELISKNPISKYLIRYIRRPRPIVIGNINPNSVDGVSDNSECELPEHLHRIILSTATQMAEAAWITSKK